MSNHAAHIMTVATLGLTAVLVACTGSGTSAGGDSIGQVGDDRGASAETRGAVTEGSAEAGTVSDTAADTSLSPAGNAADSPGIVREGGDVPDYDIVTVLAKDGIPAIDAPEFWTAEEAESRYDPDELVIGVAIDGEARAYSLPFLSSHEIVNDTVGGHPIAVTW